MKTKFHSFETIAQGRAARGEIVRVNTASGIFVGTTPRGAVWICWGAATLTDADYVEMCRKFDFEFALFRRK